MSETQTTQNICSGESFQLAHPFKIENKPVTELRLRRPKVGDIRNANSSSNNGKDELAFAVSLVLSCNLNHMTQKELDQMDGGDWVNLAEKVQSFLQ